MKELHWNARTILSLLKKTLGEFMDDNAMRLSAALSYYSIFSIAPLLLIAIGLAGYFLGQEAAEGKIAVELGRIIGYEAGEAVQTIVKSASKTSSSSTIVGFFTLILGASTVFAQLKDALNSIWGVKAKGGLGIMGFIKERVLTFGIVLVIGFLLLVSLVLTAGLAAMNGWLEAALGLPKAISGIVGFVLPLGLESLLFALLFKSLPDVKISWRSVWLGALVTAVLFEVGKSLLAWWLGKGGATSSFGAAGSVVLVMVWVYYASCILFFGAEFTQVYAEAAGQELQPTEVAQICAPANALGVSAQPIAAEPHPLHPTATVPPTPMKESLAPLLVPSMLDTELLRNTRLPSRRASEPKTKLEGWIEVAHQHPMAELGAALGVGLLAGMLGRMLERSAPNLSAADHFREGSRKAAESGGSMLADAGNWMSKRLSEKAVRGYSKTARRKSSEFADEVSEKIGSILK